MTVRVEDERSLVGVSLPPPPPNLPTSPWRPSTVGKNCRTQRRCLSWAPRRAHWFPGRLPLWWNSLCSVTRLNPSPPEGARPQRQTRCRGQGCSYRRLSLAHRANAPELPDMIQSSLRKSCPGMLTQIPRQHTKLPTLWANWTHSRSFGRAACSPLRCPHHTLWSPGANPGVVEVRDKFSRSYQFDGWKKVSRETNLWA